jgi:hypothetical protein
LQPKEIKNLDVVAIIAVKKLFLTNLVAKLINLELWKTCYLED